MSVLYTELQLRPIIHFILVFHTLFGDNYFITSYFQLNLNDMCKRFLCAQKRHFSLIRQKTKTFPIDPLFTKIANFGNVMCIDRTLRK